MLERGGFFVSFSKTGDFVDRSPLSLTPNGCMKSPDIWKLPYVDTKLWNVESNWKLRNHKEMDNWLDHMC